MTAAHEAQVRLLMAYYPYRIVYLATKDGEEAIVSAVTSMRVPNRLARQGWRVEVVTSEAVRPHV